MFGLYFECILGSPFGIINCDEIGVVNLQGLPYALIFAFVYEPSNGLSVHSAGRKMGVGQALLGTAFSLQHGSHAILRFVGVNIGDQNR